MATTCFLALFIGRNALTVKRHALTFNSNASAGSIGTGRVRVKPLQMD